MKIIQFAKALTNFSKTIDHQISQAMATEAKQFVAQNFQKGGFQGDSFQKWKGRDKNKYKKVKGKLVTSGLLVQSGTLRRSIRSERINNSTIKLATDVPYAKIHNEGGEVKKRGGKGTFTMPKRQFIGHSPVLQAACVKAANDIIGKALAKYFK